MKLTYQCLILKKYILCFKILLIDTDFNIVSFLKALVTPKQRVYFFLLLIWGEK